MSNWFQLPLIAISACNASAQFLSKSYEEYENTIITATGCTSVFVSILTAIMSYLKIGELSSTHSKAQSEWSTLYNKIRSQLMLTRELRMDGQEFLKQVKSEFKQLVEFSPLPSKSSINKVKKAIQTSRHPDFPVPPTLNGFSGIRVWDDEASFEENSV